MPSPASKEYAAAGVDLTAAAGVKRIIHGLVSETHDESVLSEDGAFCGLYDADPASEFVFASSTDSVGTKVRVAQAMGHHDTIGIDLVNHCVNDILPSGAEPLFFLDYIGSSGFDADVISEIVRGLSLACMLNGCALIAGETAALPGLYQPGDYDLVGFVVGRVPRSEVKSVESVEVGDALIALPSSGIHTNGFSLVRKVFGIDDDPSVLRERVPRLGRNLGDALLEPHMSYLDALRPVKHFVKTMAHITGGSFAKNVPRALPDWLMGRIVRSSWEVPAIFDFVQDRGRIEMDEMFSVFNMGVGMILIVAPSHVDDVLSACPGSWVIGDVIEAPRGSEGVIYA